MKSIITITIETSKPHPIIKLDERDKPVSGENDPVLTKQFEKFLHDNISTCVERFVEEGKCEEEVLDEVEEEYGINADALSECADVRIVVVTEMLPEEKKK